jgi:hypothetical protein
MLKNIRKAYAECELDKTPNRKKPDRENKNQLDGNAEAYLIALGCDDAPEGDEHWSLRLLQDRCV